MSTLMGSKNTESMYVMWHHSYSAPFLNKKSVSIYNYALVASVKQFIFIAN